MKQILRWHKSELQILDGTQAMLLALNKFNPNITVTMLQVQMAPRECYNVHYLKILILV